MATDNSVIVFGASGNVGQYLVPALVSAGVKVTVVSREGSTSTLSYENVFVAKADYNSQDSLISIIRGHGAVISLLSAGVLGLQKNLIDAAIATGVTYFIPSEYGHDTTNEEIVPLLPAFSAKREIVAYLKEKEKDGLSWTSPITALFFDWGLPKGIFGFDFKAGKATIWDGGDNPFSAANMDDISASIVRLITEPATRNTYKNQYVYVSSVQTTQNEILGAAEEITGKKFEVTKFDSEEVFKHVGKPEYSPGFLAILQGVAFSKRGLSNFEARVAGGHNQFIVNRKNNVKGIVEKAIAG